jgi:hypothetical protein
MSIFAMIDIETLNTTPDSVILSVGAVKFNPYTHEDPFQHKHWKLDVDQQFELGRTYDQSTLEWWGRQAEHIREAAFGDQGRIGLVEFAKDLNKWLVGCREIWCQGPQFDMVMIEHLFQQLCHHRNWAYWQVRDSRTLFSLMPRDPRKDIQEDLHDALADAYWQARCVQKVFSHFEVKPR